MKFKRLISAVLAVSLISPAYALCANVEFEDITSEETQLYSTAERSDQDTENTDTAIEDVVYYNRFITKSADGETELIITDEPVDAKEYVEYLYETEEDIKYAQPDYIMTQDSLDNQWSINNTEVIKAAIINEPGDKPEDAQLFDYTFDIGINKAKALSSATGVVVAIIDGSMNAEVVGDNLSNFAGAQISTNEYEEAHATSIAGIICNIADNAKLLPINVFSDGIAYTYDILQAISECEEAGVDIVNLSFSGEGDNPILKEAIEQSDMLFVCSAGNSGADLKTNPVYPAAYDLDNLVTVTSVNKYGTRSAFANYSCELVDIAAPGEEIISYVASGTESELSGTSMSAAFVTAAAAMVCSEYDSLDAGGIKNKILNAGTGLYSLKDYVKNSVCLNVGNIFDKTETYGLLYMIKGASDTINFGISTLSDDGISAMSITDEGWTEYDSMTGKRDNMASIAVGDYIYLFGGKINNTVTNKVEKYNPETGTWTTLANMPTGRYKHSAVYLNGKVYIGAGYYSSGAASPIDVYDVESDTWETVISVPSTKKNYSLAVYDNKIYVVGGKINSSSTRTVHEYDFSSDTWQQCTSINVDATDAQAVVLHDGRMGIISGSAIAAYNGSSWSIFSAMLSGLSEYAVISRDISYFEDGAAQIYENGLYITGGKNRARTVQTEARALYIGCTYNPSLEWFYDKQLETGLYNHSMVELNGYIYILGGRNQRGVQTGNIMRCNAQTVTDDYSKAITISANQTINGSINYGEDRDTFLFTPTVSGQYIIYDTPAANSNYPTTVEWVSVSKEGSNTVAEVPFYIGEITMQAGITYTINVETSSGFSAYNYSFMIKRFQRRISNDIYTATELNPGHYYQEEFGGYSDKHYYRFDVEAKGAYNILLSAKYPIGVNIRLLNSEHESITQKAYNDIIMNLDSGRYYIEVTPISEFGDGREYSLSVTRDLGYGSMSRPRNEAKAVTVNDSLYILGGTDYNSGYSHSVEHYLGNDTWGDNYDIPMDIGFSAAVSGEYIYMVGSGLKDVYRYNTTTGNCNKMAELSEWVYDAAVAVYDNKLYVIGGEGTDLYTSNIDIIDIATQTRVASEEFPIPVCSAQAFAVNNKLYVIGGYTTGDVFSRDVYRYVNGMWTTVCSIPDEISSIKMCAQDNLLIGIGRVNGVYKIIAYSCQYNKWIVSDNTVDYYGGCVGVIGNTLYSMGGIINGKVTHSVMKYDISDIISKVDNIDEFGNTFETATLISDINETINGSIGYEGDVDFIKFTASATNTYSIKCISCGGVSISLYDSTQKRLKADFTQNNSTLTKGRVYYIKAEGSGEYLLSVQESNSEAEKFNIYDFDIELREYRKLLDSRYEGMYHIDKEKTKESYNKLQQLIVDETALHVLPEFLEKTPKDTQNFDSIINMYYSALYNDFMKIKEEYKNLLDTEYLEEENVVIKYDSPNGGYIIPEEDTEEISLHAAVAKDPEIVLNSVGTNDIQVYTQFPYNDQTNNKLYLIDFEQQFVNGTNGLWKDLNINYSKTWNVNGLSPGRVYILQLQYARGTVCHRVYTEYEGEEIKETFSGQYVDAVIEKDDIKLYDKSKSFETWLQRMDQVYQTYYDLTGYRPYCGQKMVIESTREDLSENGQVYVMPNNSPGWEIVYGHSGKRIQFMHPHYTDLIRRLGAGDWGDTPIHELSHNFDMERWEFDSEALAFFKMCYALEIGDGRNPGKVYRSDLATYPIRNIGEYESGWIDGDRYRNFLTNLYYKGYNKCFKNGTYSGAGLSVVLLNIQEKIGWEPFKKTFRYFMSLDDDQVTWLTNGEKLLIFLTKLKDYSGQPVLSYINNDDKAIINNEFGITLDYVIAPYPELNINGRNEAEVDVPELSGDVVYQFKASKSANYYIYTSAYNGTGTTNDTYIEVYDTADFTGTPIASNDDHEGGRFSQVNIPVTAGHTYYIKLRHYNGGRLHTTVGIREYVPVTNLTEGNYIDVSVPNGDYTMYSFTPEKSGVYTFYAENYEGGEEKSDTYLKLYNDTHMKRLIGNEAEKIIIWLDEGITYYLQFSGYFMTSAKARVGVRAAHTIEFKKRTDSGFMFVNHPEFITKYDIVDDESHIENQVRLKLFEQKNITGKNTYYQTQTVWYGENHVEEYYPSKNQFYIDIDFYNPTSNTIKVDVSNITRGIAYGDLVDYYKGGNLKNSNIELSIPAHTHILLFETLKDYFLITRPGINEAWARIPVLMFDFEVRSGNVTVSTLAAYNRSNLYLRYGTNNILDLTGYELDAGDIIYDISSRPDEADLWGKYKGHTEDESAWIDADLEFLIDNNTKIGGTLAVNLKDEFYNYGIDNPKYEWYSSVSPLNDINGVLFALPNSLHNFKYHHDDGVRTWNFDFIHSNLKRLNLNGNANESVNLQVDDMLIDNAKLDMASGVKEHFGENEIPDRDALSIGEWGTTYHYTITVKNTTANDREVRFDLRYGQNIIVGIKEDNERDYELNFYEAGGKKIGIEDQQTWEERHRITVPAGTQKTFEAITMLTGGAAGLQHRLVVE